MSDKSPSVNWTQYLNVSSSGAIASEADRYGKKVTSLLFDCFLRVIRIRCPEIEPILLGQQELRESNQDLLTFALQAYGIWFQLLSIADQNAYVKRRRIIEVEIGHDEVPGTFAQVISQAAREKIPAEKIQAILENTFIYPVITAHPTEAKRVTVLEIHRRIYVLLIQLEQERWTPYERNALKQRVYDEIDLLWLTGEIRLEKPTVQQEVAWGLHFFNESLYQGVSELYTELEDVLRTHYPNFEFNIPAVFQFGSWIGGDRDGNPFVTNEITKQTFSISTKASLNYYIHEINKLGGFLSIADHSITLPDSFYNKLKIILEKSGELDKITVRNPGEVFRQICVCISKRLTATLHQLSTNRADDFAYNSVDNFAKDLRVIEEGLLASNSASLCMNYVRPMRHTVEAFGFHTVRLDIRQNSTITTKALYEIWHLDTASDKHPPDKFSPEWRSWLLSKLKEPLGMLPNPSLLSDASVETLDLFKIVSDVRQDIDREAVGTFILSMTQSSEDILGVYLLAKYAGLFTDTQGTESCRILVVPLLETIDDLRRGTKILEELLVVPLVQRTVKKMGGCQEIMVGYSDSNKDGGYLCASWEISKAQKNIYRTGKDLGTQISFFHGRGGSVSRGGAPAGRAIAAQPAGTVNGRMRVTEQGEVVSSKYANRKFAEQQMELLAASVLSHTLFSEQDVNLETRAEYDEIMEALAGTAYVAYRRLVEHPGLVEFYQSASPVEELALMNIGSRPARRFGATTLDDLRAIPWVFAWTQNRLMIPGWYGFGTAIDQLINIRGEQGKATIDEMFVKCPIFKLIVDNVEKTLFLVDMEIASEYGNLVENQTISNELLAMISAEKELTERMVLAITKKSVLCEQFPNFRRSMNARLDGIKQVGLEQVKLVQQFREARAKGTSTQDHLVSLLLSINCVAAGLGWTG